MFGVSEGFASKWWNRWKKNKHWGSLRTRSTRPRRVHVRKHAYANEIVETKQKRPFLGAQKIKAMLKLPISHQNVHEMLVEAGLVKQGKKKRRVWRSFSRKHSNPLWQCDVMDLDDTKTTFLVTFIDDHSRFVLASKALASATGEATVEMLHAAVSMFGKPRQILTDHGCQFWHAKSEGPTVFGTTCRALGTKHIMASVRKPTTCGKIERWHRSFQDELCKEKDWDVGKIEKELPKYLEWYNTERPHFAVGLEAPGTVYLAGFMSVEDFVRGTSVHEVGG